VSRRYWSKRIKGEGKGLGVMEGGWLLSLLGREIAVVVTGYLRRDQVLQVQMERLLLHL